MDRIAVLSLILEDPGSVGEVNRLLHECGDLVVGRMGLPYRTRGLSIITLVLDGPQERISALSGRLGRLSGVRASTSYAKAPAEASREPSGPAGP